jgi:ActR/RegA family two-component response regulator
VREASSETRIVFITGYDSEEIVHGSPDLMDVERYSKPLDFDALIASMRRSEILGANPQQPRAYGV